MMVDIIIPSLKKDHAWKCIESLRHIPFGYCLHLMTKERSWPEAINAGIKESSSDILIMDDDIEILPNTFKDFADHYYKGDVFGFKLLYPDGKIQHAGGLVNRESLGHLGRGEDDSPRHSRLMEVSHVTASLMYVKKHVIDKVGGMETEWKGMQFEDVDFNLRVLKAGYKIIYIPNSAIHGESQSKNKTSDFWDKLEKNKQALAERYLSDNNLMESLKQYPKVLCEI